MIHLFTPGQIALNDTLYCERCCKRIPITDMDGKCDAP